MSAYARHESSVLGCECVLYASAGLIMSEVTCPSGHNLRPPPLLHHHNDPGPREHCTPALLIRVRIMHVISLYVYATVEPLIAGFGFSGLRFIRPPLRSQTTCLSLLADDESTLARVCRDPTPTVTMNK